MHLTLCESTVHGEVMHPLHPSTYIHVRGEVMHPLHPSTYIHVHGEVMHLHAPYYMYMYMCIKRQLE